MAIKRVMSGSPWHVEKMVRKEGDSRRHRSRCIYYNKSNKYCTKVVGKCVGSAHCSYYEECFREEFEQNEVRDKQVITNVEQDNKLKLGMKIVGRKIIHNKYGKGKITKITGNKVDILFESGKTASFNIELCIKNSIIKFVDN